MMLPFPEILLRLVVAIVLGALIGLERETSEHTAGIRTNALVALGAALFTIISAFGFMELLRFPHVSLDPTRIASYVIAGIGFLGGGAIFFVQDKERVRGLTTAAAIWIVAAIGMACGAGMLWEAISATLLALTVLILLRLVERRLLTHRLSGTLHIRIEATSAGGQFIAQVYDTCSGGGVLVEKVEVRSGQGHEIVNLACHSRNMAALTSTLGGLRSLSGVNAVNADLKEANRKEALSNASP